MDNRSSQLLQSRPKILSAFFNDSMSSGEHFQNATLRPAVQFQAELLIEAFRNYAGKHKGVFYDLTPEKRIDYIENAIQRDMKFRNSLKGMVIGVFSVEEYKEYIKDSSALNKRMMGLVKEHLIKNIQVFQHPQILSASWKQDVRLQDIRRTILCHKSYVL